MSTPKWILTISEFFQRDKVRKIVNFIGPFILFLYLLIGISAYINWFPGSAKYFRSNSTTGVLFRAFSSALICIYSLFVLLANKEKFPWRWLFVILALLAIVGISILVTPHEYYYVYKASLYGYLRSTYVYTGWKDLLVKFLSSISDFAIGFCFLLILPHCITNKKQILIVLLPMVVLMLFECAYSIVKERSKYIELFSHITEIFGGYNISIGATFGDKQEFGAYLTVGFSAALMSALVLLKKKKWYWILLSVICFASSVLFFIITFFTLCKTAMLANCFIVLFTVVGLLFIAFKNNKLAGFIFLGVCLLFLLGFLAFLYIPQLHSSGILHKAYILIYDNFLSKLIKGVISRDDLSRYFFENVDGFNFFFGLSKAGINSFMTNATVEGQTGLHTGFTYYFACYGLAGFIIYIFFLLIVIKNILKCYKVKPFIMFVFLGFFMGTVVYNLSECEVFLMSGSAPIFTFNVILCLMPKYYAKELVTKTPQNVNRLEVQNA